MRSLQAIFTIATLSTPVALAQDVAPNSTGPIRVGGYQEVLCAAGFADESVPVDLTSTPSQAVQVTIECNTPFTLGAKADNGELRNTAEYAANDPLTFVPYTVIWPSLLDYQGTAIGPDFTNSGTNWAGGLEATSAPTRTLQIGSMTVQWGPPPEVIAGEYTDTFELNIVAN